MNWCRRPICGLTLAALGLLVAVTVASGWMFLNVAIGRRTKLEATFAFGSAHVDLTTVNARTDGSIIPSISAGMNPEYRRSGRAQWSFGFGYGWHDQLTPGGIDTARWVDVPILVVAPVIAVPWLLTVMARRRAANRA